MLENHRYIENTANIFVRDATVADAEAAATIHVRTWQAAYRGQVPDDYLDSLDIGSRTTQWQEKLSHPAPRTRNLVAEVNQKIVGFCDIGRSRDDDATNDVGEIFAIYVAADYLGKGIGTKLLNEAVQALTDFGFKSVTLWVLESNARGRHFYEQNGWVVEGKMKSEIHNNVTLREVRYKRDLNQEEAIPRRLMG
jgi:ribosomal protein S18 acetylase RimI-like enzyme